MKQQTHRRRVGDTRTALSVLLQQENEAGVLTAVDLTGLTVSFEMVEALTGDDKIATTISGVTVVDAEEGIVDYVFSSGGVDEGGIFYATFTVTESGATDSFPVMAKGLRVMIDSDTQTAEEIYKAAVDAL